LWLYFFSYLIGQLERAGCDGDSIQLNIEVVASTRGERDRGSVGTVEVVLRRDGGLRYTTICLVDSQGVEGKNYGLAMLVSGLDGNSEVLVIGFCGIGSRQDTNGERSILDSLSFQGDLNLDGSGLVRSVGDSVGTIVVVDDVGVDVWLFGTSNLDDEGISSINAGFAFVIYGMDGELGGFVIKHLSVSDTVASGIRASGQARPFDLGVERSIFDGLTMEVDIDGIFSGFLDLIGDTVSAVTVVSDLGIDRLGTRDLDIEWITSLFDPIAVSIHREDGEFARVFGLSMGQTVTFGVGSSSVGVLHQRTIGRSLDGLSVEGDIDLVASGDGWGVAPLVGSILGVIELDHDRGTVGVFDSDSKVVASGGHISAVLVH